MTNEIVLYKPNEQFQLEVQLKDDTVWLTQEQIAMLFGTQRPAITKHLNNIYNSGELTMESTCSILERMGNDGRQRYQTKYYNLDAILSVGYRVNSKNATLFRQWANKVIKEQPVNTHKWSKSSHDRWVIIDDTLYHCGHSVKDLGKKLSAIMKMDWNPEVVLKEVR